MTIVIIAVSVILVLFGIFIALIVVGANSFAAQDAIKKVDEERDR